MPDLLGFGGILVDFVGVEDSPIVLADVEIRAVVKRDADHQLVVLQLHVLDLQTLSLCLLKSE